MTTILSLPDEVIERILYCTVRDGTVADLISMALTCRKMHTFMPMVYALRPLTLNSRHTKRRSRKQPDPSVAVADHPRCRFVRVLNLDGYVKVDLCAFAAVSTLTIRGTICEVLGYFQPLKPPGDPGELEGPQTELLMCPSAQRWALPPRLQNLVFQLRTPSTFKRSLRALLPTLFSDYKASTQPFSLLSGQSVPLVQIYSDRLLMASMVHPLLPHRKRAVRLSSHTGILLHQLVIALAPTILELYKIDAALLFQNTPSLGPLYCSCDLLVVDSVSWNEHHTWQSRLPRSTRVVFNDHFYGGFYLARGSASIRVVMSEHDRERWLETARKNVRAQAEKRAAATTDH